MIENCLSRKIIRDFLKNHSENKWKDLIPILIEIGILIPGDRINILIRIFELANNFNFDLPKNFYYSDNSYNDNNNILNRNDNILNNNIIQLKNYLKNLKLERYLMNFINNGYHSIELLLMQMETENRLTTEILRDEIGIDKIGYRSRILYF